MGIRAGAAVSQAADHYMAVDPGERVEGEVWRGVTMDEVKSLALNAPDITEWIIRETGGVTGGDF